MATKRPTSLTIRMYRVGFGDCFLLSFAYPDRQRHVLIDCGSMGGPRGTTPSAMLLRAANDIRERTGGELEAVVATHRHADHINGFARGLKKPNAPGDILRELRPRLVIQPWTEDPRAAPDATKASRKLPPAAAYISRLNAMNRGAEALMHHLESARTSLGRARGVSLRAIKELEFLGADNLPNLSAVENLATMARTKSGQKYVAFGDDCGLGKLLPGVKVHVLGPPTLEQSGAIGSQRRKDETEYWLRAASLLETLDSGSQSPLFPRAPSFAVLPPPARRLAKGLGAVRAEQVRSIVRELDTALNNTSVILLFEFTGQRVLFPGDAQLESWLYALRHARNGPKDIAADVRDLLRDVTVYKVGHHGSNNATPKSLWKLFERKGVRSKRARLHALLSTHPGKHGHPEEGTEVPRRTLVEELARQTNLISTTDLSGPAFYADLRIDA